MASIVPIQLRGDTAANWTANNTILRAREMAVETDTKRFKIGDGTTAWNSLPYGGLIATNPTFSGTVTASTFSGNLTGNVTGNVTGTASTATAIPSGTSFPSSPVAGQKFLRTDTQIQYTYSGSAWVAEVSEREIHTSTFLLMGA